MKKSNHLIRNLLSLVIILAGVSQNATAQGRQNQRIKAEDTVILKTELTDLESQQVELLRQKNEAVTFVADYESFQAKGKKTQAWILAEADLYRRVQLFDEQVKNLGKSGPLPMNRISESSMTFSDLVSALSGIAGIFTLANGLIDKRKGLIAVGAVILGTVITVHVGPKFIQAILHDRLSNAKYIEGAQSQREVEMKYEEFKYKIPELDAKIKEMESKRVEKRGILASLR